MRSLTMLSRRELLALTACGTAGAMALHWPAPAYGAQGLCERRFEAVREVFQRSFDDGEDVGANVAVTLDGRLVVNLWGGYRDAAKTLPWQENTLVCTMSVSKGITALCAHLLIDRGQLDVNERVARYWPEFAAAGKGAITVRHLLSHLAALPIAEQAPTGAAFDWNALVRALEIQAPVWEPGTTGSYHATTYGNLVGELVQRVSGRGLAEFVHEEIEKPLDVEFVFGCNDEEHARLAPPIPNPMNHHARRDQSSRLAQETYRILGENAREALLSPDFCRNVFPSASGISNAHSLARIFAFHACGGRIENRTLLRPATLALVSQEQWYGADPIHHDKYRVAMGYLLNGGIAYYGPNPRSFGTAGSGGYTVFADPDRRMSFAFTPNRFTTGEGLGIQSRRLVDAVYRALDA